MHPVWKIALGWFLIGIAWGLLVGFTLFHDGPARPICALTTTVEDVGWRDANGQTHDFMPRCSK